MSTFNLDAYLGDTNLWDTPPTDSQRLDIRDAATAIAERYPDPDDALEAEAALTAAAQVILGGATVEDIAARATAAITAQRQARAAQAGVAIALAGTYPSEQALADALGVTRMTVRDWLGK